MHVHHEDYVTVPIGRAFVGLCDLRREEPTFLHSSLVEIGERNPLAVIIPRGVAHGFFFPEDAVHFYGMSRTFDPNDEIGCRFDDPDLGIEWPRRDVLLSERDERLQSLTQLLEAFEEARLRAEGEG